MTVILTVAVSLSLGASRCGVPDSEIRLSHAIKFDGPNGKRLMELVPRGQRVKLENARGELVVRFRLEAGRLRIELASRELVGFVAPQAADTGGLQVVGARGASVLYRLRREPDGDLKLQDGAGRTVYEVKLRDYGFKTVDARGAVQSRVRVKPTKVSVRDAAGKTTLSTDDSIPPPAAACFTLNGLPLEFQTGLALAIIHWGASSL